MSMVTCSQTCSGFITVCMYLKRSTREKHVNQAFIREVHEIKPAESLPNTVQQHAEELDRLNTTEMNTNIDVCQTPPSMAIAANSSINRRQQTKPI